MHSKALFAICIYYSSQQFLMLNTKSKGQKRQPNKHTKQFLNICEKTAPEQIIWALLDKLKKEKGLKQNYKKKYQQEKGKLDRIQNQMNQILDHYHTMKAQIIENLQLTRLLSSKNQIQEGHYDRRDSIYQNIKKNKVANAQVQQNKKSVKPKYFIENVEHAVSVQHIQTIIQTLNQDKFRKQDQYRPIQGNFTKSNSGSKKTLKTIANSDKQFRSRHKRSSMSQLLQPTKQVFRNQKVDKTWQNVSKVLGLMIQQKGNPTSKKMSYANQKDHLQNEKNCRRTKSKSMDNLNKLNIVNMEAKGKNKRNIQTKTLQFNKQNDHSIQRKSVNVSINQYLAEFNIQAQSQSQKTIAHQKFKQNQQSKTSSNKFYDEKLLDLIQEIYL